MVLSLLCFLCSTQEWNYLSFRFWIGIWMAGILLIMVAFDLSALVRASLVQSRLLFMMTSRVVVALR